MTQYLKYLEILFIFILIFLVIILRLPSIFEPYWHRDEGITLTVGQAISRGEILYKDVADNKTPLLYFIASIFNTLPLLRTWLFFWMIATTLTFYLLARKIIRNNWSIFVTFIFILVTSTPLMEGNIVNGEIAFLLPNLLGGYFFLKAMEGKEKYFFLSGIFFAIAFLFKQAGIFDFMGIGIFLMFFADYKLKEKLLTAIKLGVGFLVPNVFILFYFIRNNAMADYFEYGFKWNFIYSSWHNDFLIPNGITIIKAIILLLILIFIRFQQKKLDQNKTLLLIWFLFALYGSFLSARFYIHYFLQFIPSLLLLGGLITLKIKKLMIIPLGMIIFIVLFFSSFGEKKFRLGYYQNYFQYITSKKSVEDYRNYFDWYTNRTYKVADFLNLGKRGKIFIWGDEPLIYALSNRSMVGRFPTAYNIYWEKKRMEETEKKLQEDPPRYILIMDSIKTPFEKLDKIVKQKYTLVKIIKDTKIYERKI